MMFGLGLATAVFLDAFVIRVILLPAVMDLAANATWWLPNWLDRLLPHLGIEGDTSQPSAVPDGE
jgi:RND superfamily putative drug exporter